LLRDAPNRRLHDESNEGINVKNKQTKPDSSEPYYYIALVIKGTEKQYLNLLKYVNNKNGAQVIYQCKSLTYLRVNKDDCTNMKTVTAEAPIQIQVQGAEY
jgi:hypothetical protein